MQHANTHLDDLLARLDASLRGRDRDRALALLLAFDGELTRYVRGEERFLFPVLDRFTSLPGGATARMRHEHRSLRRLLDVLGSLIARADADATAVLADLRSVLLLHVEKEAWLLDPWLRSVRDDT